ncbi:MAG: plasma membrane calcium [Thelocarpon superellum]|nr:MAG: plasma membrane calcium [Thelocarpon superellum]
MANRLLAPPISINTSFLRENGSESGGESRPITPSSVGDDRSLLTLQVPVSPTTLSLDGETLRSRSNSYASPARSIDLSTEDALLPDPGTEEDFVVSNNPFAFSPGQLNKMLNPKSLAAYKALGGLSGLARGLRTDLSAGLSVDEAELSGTVTFEEAVLPTAASSKAEYIAPVSHGAAAAAAAGAFKSSQFLSRFRVFRDNRLPEKKGTSILALMWMAYNDKILILLTIAAVVSLALGVYEAVGQKPAPGQPRPVDWVEGVAICVAIIIVVLVGAINDWQKERQFLQLNKKKDDRLVKVNRSGATALISVFDLTVGDVVHLEPGDLVPADGVFIGGHNIKCDESSATGESDQMKKTPGDVVSRHLLLGVASSKSDPFIIAGSKVLEGVGTYLVTSVGVNSGYGKTLLALQQPSEQTPLQVKLNGLASAIAKLGGGAALLLFVVLFIEFLATLSSNTGSAAVKARSFFDILIVAVTIVVVAVPEGLPLAVTLALAFATTRMLKENNLVRVLRSCETMGNATTVCSDKTGTLTQNKMTVVAGTVGSDASFAHRDGVEKAVLGGSATTSIAPTHSVMEYLSTALKDILRQSIVINSTAFEGEQEGVRSFIGSKTETALLRFAQDHIGIGPVAEERASTDVTQLFPFDSRRKCMGAVVRLPCGDYRVLVKGAAEILLAHATKVTKVVPKASSAPLLHESMSDAMRTSLSSAIDDYAHQSLRTIAFLYRDFPSWPPLGVPCKDDDKHQVELDDLLCDMTFLAVVGIQDPLRPGVVHAVQLCQAAGVTVRMVTGDSAATAEAIASTCGIKTAQGVAMEGPEFRRLSEDQMDDILPRLQVLARSSPEDKRILVARLKYLGETVAVTGDGTNDAPALKCADVGFSMGIAGTEVAKEASSIILMDDNFSSIITAIRWGRAVNDAVAKFLQFQITVNITAVVLAFVSAVSNADRRSVLTAVQLLWVNLIMDTFAALALATDPPTSKILDRKPAPKKAALISVNMWKMIAGQAVYQLVVTFILYFLGPKILGYSTDAEKAQLSTIVFNTFVWMQIFNELNCRRLDNKFNIFEGMHRNWIFVVINAIMIGGQILIMFVGGLAFQIVGLNGTQWAICILCAVFCLPWAILLRLTPDAFAATLFRGLATVVTAVSHPIIRGIHALAAPVVRFLRRLLGRNASAMVMESGSPSDSAEREVHFERAPPSPHLGDLPPPPITITILA